MRKPVVRFRRGSEWRVLHLARVDCIEKMVWECGLATIGAIETSLGAIG